MHDERQIDRTPFAERRIEQHELRRSRTATLEIAEQLESPMVLVGREHLPAAFVVVPVAPDPVAAGEFRRQQSCGLVQRDHLLAFRGWVADRVPDRLRRFGTIGGVGVAVEEIEDRLAAFHLHPAVRFAVLAATRWIAAAADRFGVNRSACTRSPLVRQLKDAESRPVAQSHDGPLQPDAAFLPQDASRAERRAPQRRHIAGCDLGKRVGLTQHIDPRWRDARSHGATDAVGADRFVQDHELLAEDRFVGRTRIARKTDLGQTVAVERRAVLEFGQVLERFDDRLVDHQHVEPIAVAAAEVLDLDDAGLPELLARVLEQVMPARALLANRVDERVVRLGRDFQPLAAMHLF